MSALFHLEAEGGKLPKKPGVCELLEYLKTRGVKIGLATSTREKVVLKELKDGGILPFFDVIVCGDMVKRSKPDPDIYLEACSRLHVRPSECFAIEDSYNGIRAACRAGMKAIMVPDLAKPTEEMEKLAERILPSLHEVKEYFEEIPEK